LEIQLIDFNFNTDFVELLFSFAIQSVFFARSRPPPSFDGLQLFDVPGRKSEVLCFSFCFFCPTLAVYIATAPKKLEAPARDNVFMGLIMALITAQDANQVCGGLLN
jgi:hypothetical protein